MAQQLKNFAKPLGLSGMPLGDFVQTLAEDPPLTARVLASPASDANHQFHGPPLYWEIPQMPQVAAVPGGGPHPTVWADGCRRARRGTNHPAVRILVDAARLQRALIGQQLFAIQCIFHDSSLLMLASGHRSRLHQK
jgi:hypothetical protein